MQTCTRLFVILVAGLTLAACGDDGGNKTPDARPRPDARIQIDGPPGPDADTTDAPPGTPDADTTDAPPGTPDANTIDAPGTPDAPPGPDAPPATADHLLITE